MTDDTKGVETNNNAFEYEVARQLMIPIDPSLVSDDGRNHAQIPWFITADQLNRIFGPWGWSSEVLECIVLDADNSSGKWNITCMSRVRLVVENNGRRVTKTSVGSFSNTQPKKGAAMEVASMGSESIAFKRCATKLGPAFGLHLYTDKKVSIPLTLEPMWIKKLKASEGHALPEQTQTSQQQQPPTTTTVTIEEVVNETVVDEAVVDKVVDKVVPEVTPEATKPLTKREAKRKAEKDAHSDPARPIYVLTSLMDTVDATQRQRNIIKAYICHNTKADSPTAAPDKWVQGLLNKMTDVYRGDGAEAVRARVDALIDRLPDSLKPPQEKPDGQPLAQDMAEAIFQQLTYAKVEMELGENAKVCGEAHTILVTALGEWTTKRINLLRNPDSIAELTKSLRAGANQAKMTGQVPSDIIERCLSGDLVPF